LREERTLKVSENRVLRKIFRPQRNVIRRKWRRLLKKELNELYSSPNIIRLIKSRIMRCSGHLARMTEKRDAYRILVGSPERKKTTWTT
jgi:hypothetical protein